jgi:S-adenosylmethionine uptake transporter
MHAWRSLVGVISLGAWFYAIAILPLATAMTLNYMSSVWVATFPDWRRADGWNPRSGASTALRQGPLVLTVLAGFAGVVMMLRPTIEQNQVFAGLVGLLSGFMAAFAYMQVMALGKLGRARKPHRVLLCTGLGGGRWRRHAGHGRVALELAARAVAAAGGPAGVPGQLCMTRAYSQGATLVVANLQYSGIVFGALYSVLLFDDVIPWIGWAGMALIMASGIAATVLRARAAPNAPGRRTLKESRPVHTTLISVAQLRALQAEGAPAAGV